MESTPDGIIVAWLHGEAGRRAGWSDPQGHARTEAIEELQRLAGGRADLLAKVAGRMLGFNPPGSPSHERFRIAAGLLVDAGADEDQVEQWRQEAARRRAPLPPSR